MSINYAIAKEKATKLLNSHLYHEPPINSIDIANGLGINVFKGTLPNSISGLLDYENKRIIINKQDPIDKQNFTIAHEIGHFILHSKWVKSKNGNIILKLNSFNDNQQELEADTFAANLLVPCKMLSKYYQIATHEELSVLFCVPSLIIRNKINKHYSGKRQNKL
ncbi:MAG: ImmA/IrrE family metallo-endopeptidase [Alphaproteobacteria bacterium]|nr:ImmA/IrrE family metallo-endopeptidase [Rickettsiales bacterium]